MAGKERGTEKKAVILAVIFGVIGLLMGAGYYWYMTEDFMTQKGDHLVRVTIEVDYDTNEARTIDISDKTEMLHIYSLLEMTNDISVDRFPNGEEPKDPNLERSSFRVIFGYRNGEANAYWATDEKRFVRMVMKWRTEAKRYGRISGANEALWDYIFDLTNETEELLVLEEPGEEDTVGPAQPEGSAPGSSAQGSSVKITEEEAGDIAFKAAKEARSTVLYWKGAVIRLRQIQLIQRTPNYVYPIEEIDKTHDSYEGQINMTMPMYEVWFVDTNEVASSLRIFVDANTGAVIGGSYSSD